MLWVLLRRPPFPKNRTLLTLFPFLSEPLSSTPHPPKPPDPRNPRRLRKYPISKPNQSPPPPDPTHFHHAISHLPPRLTTEDLSLAISHHKDPIFCFHLFNWASHQPRFRHDLSTHLLTIKKLGSARMYTEMDSVAAQALSSESDSAFSESLFNTLIYFYAEGRMLSKAVNVYKRMRDHPNAAHCRPTIGTYNLLFGALLGSGSNSYINHVYMDTIRSLFRQMVNAGVEPDVFAVNAVIKGYVLSLHLNDALRVFHQMGVVYKCLPNEHSYNHLVHGLCAQGRTKNARQLYEEMKGKGFMPGERACNSLASALAMEGDVDGAVGVLREMKEMRRRPAEVITYLTVVEELCKKGRVGDALGLVRELRDEGLVDGRTCRELLCGIQDDYGGGVEESGRFYQRQEVRTAVRRF